MNERLRYVATYVGIKIITTVDDRGKYKNES
jgi:hypothetical protein